MLDRGKVCAWNPKKSSVISATVFRYEPKVSQISGTIFLQNSPSTFRVILMSFHAAFSNIQQNILVFTFSGSHARIYHDSKTVDPIRKNSAILPNIRVPWKRLAEKLAFMRKEFSLLLLILLTENVYNRSINRHFSQCKQVTFCTLETFLTFLSFMTCTRVT